MRSHILGVEIPENRVFGLDLLRAVAIIQVVLGHGVYDLAAVVPVQWATMPLVNGGVTLFFVLSGYLIGRILIREFDPSADRPGNLKRFWLRRWFRTLPAYFLVLTLLVAHYVITHGELFTHWWRYFLFIQNFAMEHPKFFPEAWSLSIEEWFYLIIPLGYLAIAATRLKAQRGWMLLIILVIVGSPLIRYLYYMQAEAINMLWWDLNVRKNVITRLDSLAFGMLGAYCHSYHARAWQRWRIPALVLGCLLILANRLLGTTPIQALKDMPVYYSVFYLSMLSLGMLLMLPFMSSWHLKGGALFRWVTFISIISYSMYLLHLSVIRRVILPMVFDHLPEMSDRWEHGLIYISYWMLTIVLSALLYRSFERPAMNLRDRFD